MIQPASQHDLCGLMPHARQYAVTILDQRPLGHHMFVVRVSCPEIARQIVPGQFFMIRPDVGNDPMLGRPFALYDTILDENGHPVAFEFAYHVIGKMTRLMSQWKPGTTAQVWGPLGNGFPVFRGQHLMCIGGGIGYTPFFAVARETLQQRTYGTDSARQSSAIGHRPRVSLLYGVQSKSLRADLSDLEALPGLSISISTDDGSEGQKGFVTTLLEQSLRLQKDRPDMVYCCGPEPMMHAVARLCRTAGVDCWLSLESPMACGFGACFSCVTKVRDPESAEGWDYRRTCVEGPIFPASQLWIE